MEAQLIDEQELIKYKCDDGSQVIIATSEEVIAAAGCDISSFEGQVLEVLHEPGSGNIIVQANFTTTENSLNDATLVELEGHSIDITEESDPDSSSSDPYKCHICETTFNSKNTLKLHLTVHVDEALYACEFCSASKIHWKEMWLHQCSNADSIPIVCPQCHKTVSTKKQLQVHEEVHELQRRFTSKRMDGYFQRKLQEAEDPVVDWGVKPFICGVCGKPFSKLYEVEYHEKLHTGERTAGNNCGKCGLSYINRHDLNKHLALGCTGELTRKTDAPFRRIRQPDVVIPIHNTVSVVYTSNSN